VLERTSSATNHCPTAAPAAIDVSSTTGAPVSTVARARSGVGRRRRCRRSAARSRSGARAGSVVGPRAAHSRPAASPRTAAPRGIRSPP